jgi:hypothetical protein
MNVFESAKNLLELCPIPSVIQQLILNSFIGYGTPSSQALKITDNDEEIPIRVVVMEVSDKFRYSIYYMDKVINRYYDYSSSHHSLIALCELHIIYLFKKQIQPPYVLLKLRELCDHMNDYTKRRLLRLMDEESKVKK